MLEEIQEHGGQSSSAVSIRKETSGNKISSGLNECMSMIKNK